LTPSEKRRRFQALAKHLPSVKTGREFEAHHGQLELDFSAAKVKPAYRRAPKHQKKDAVR
jgi:hypothetical protein